MLMINNLKNYLYDKKYVINLFDNCIHIFNYQVLKDFSSREAIFIIDNFKIIIKGENLLIIKMLKNEILIEGNILTLEKTYEPNMD